MKEKIQELIVQNQAIKERTPWLDVSLGGLRAALDNIIEHEKALVKRAADSMGTETQNAAGS